MIIELKSQATTEDLGRLQELVRGPFRTTKYLEMSGRRFIAISGARRDVSHDAIASDPAVAAVTSPDATTFFCRREFSPERTSQIPLGTQNIGDGKLRVIAGPCTVEGSDELYETARQIKRLGAHALRGGAFKPRTSPYNFQGLGFGGLELLAEVGRQVGIPIVSEVLDPRDVGKASSYVDMIQIGTRNMTNQALLKSLGAAHRPILLKRGSSSRLEELVRAAEFIVYEGNPLVALCERGIQTFETATRFTLDIAAVPTLRRMTHLPIVVDPSHAAGSRDLVTPLALAAAIAGADALLVEVHIDPERMIKPGDDAQALRIDEFAELLAQLRTVLAAVGRELAPPLGIGSHQSAVRPRRHEPNPLNVTSRRVVSRTR
jgi:3-deoxy-7-phosphoheptulonate synthase